MSHRLSFVSATLLPLSLLACGGGGGSGEPVPSGPHNHYVANKAFVPTTNMQAQDFGLDLGSSKTNKPDGTKDNQLGMVLSTLSTMGFDIQTTIDTAVAKGSIILLADVQTPDFMNTTGAGLQIFLGANPQPMPCTDMNDTVCGHHLDGHGMFSIATNSPQNAALAGKIAGGTFDGGPGDVTLQIALGGTMAITLNLAEARAELTGISATGIMSAILAGEVSQDEINNQVIPAVQTQLGPIIMRDCNMLNMPPGCGCAAGSTGKTILGLFDTNMDCMVSVQEIQMNSLIKSLLAPDVCSMPTCDKADSLSLGIKITAVPATFTVAGEM
jgi:hypothetical protein